MLQVGFRIFHNMLDNIDLALPARDRLLMMLHQLVGPSWASGLGPGVDNTIYPKNVIEYDQAQDNLDFTPPRPDGEKK